MHGQTEEHFTLKQAGTITKQKTTSLPGLVACKEDKNRKDLIKNDVSKT